MQMTFERSMMTRAPAIALVCGLLLAMHGAPAAGQATPATSKSPPARALALKKLDGLTNGKLAYVVTRTTRDEQRFYSSNLLVTQPVIVTLKADDPADDIRLRVTKTQWSKAERAVSTGSAGRVQVKFRTQGEFGLAVSGDGAGKPYRMTVWVGDEVKRPLSAVVVPRSTWKSGATSGATSGPASAPASQGTDQPTLAATTNTGGSLVIWLVAGLLVVIVGLLVALLRQKRE